MVSPPATHAHHAPVLHEQLLAVAALAQLHPGPLHREDVRAHVARRVDAPRRRSRWPPRTRRARAWDQRHRLLGETQRTSSPAARCIVHRAPWPRLPRRSSRASSRYPSSPEAGVGADQRVLALVEVDGPPPQGHGGRACRPARAPSRPRGWTRPGPPCGAPAPSPGRPSGGANQPAQPPTVPRRRRRGRWSPQDQRMLRVPAELHPVADHPAVLRPPPARCSARAPRASLPGASSTITCVVVPTYTRSTIEPSMRHHPGLELVEPDLLRAHRELHVVPHRQSPGTAARRADRRRAARRPARPRPAAGSRSR